MPIWRIVELGDKRTTARRPLPSTHDYAPRGSHTTGLIGEVRFAERFGLAADLIDRPKGDGGRDFVVFLPDEYRVNVQTRETRSPLDLAVPHDQVGRSDIHVLVELGPNDEIMEMWWQWEKRVLEYCPEPVSFPSRSRQNHLAGVRPTRQVRPIDDELGPRLLASRVVAMSGIVDPEAE